jgi:hypothetical protein
VAVPFANWLHVAPRDLAHRPWRRWRRWRRRRWRRRRWWRRWRPIAGRELEAPDPRSPVELRRPCRVVLVRVPERAVVDRVDRQVAVVAPAVARAGLAARSGEERRLALGELVQRIGREPARVADLRDRGRAGSAEAEREVTGRVHRGASHPAPRRVGLVRALLEDGDGPRRHVAKLDPADSGHAAGADRVVGNQRLVVAEVAVRGPEHPSGRQSRPGSRRSARARRRGSSGRAA